MGTEELPGAWKKQRDAVVLPHEVQAAKSEPVIILHPLLINLFYISITIIIFLLPVIYRPICEMNDDVEVVTRCKRVLRFSHYPHE